MSQSVSILNRMINKLLSAFVYGEPKCKNCRVKMEADEKLLFLIPVWTDQENNASLDYYCKNMRPISSVHEIPTGQRACRAFLFSCPQCGEKKVRIDDFLRVREEEVIQDMEYYDEAALISLLNAASKCSQSARPW